MKKVLSVLAASAFVLTAGIAFAGGPGKKMDDSCPEPCQQQIDDLQSSQAQQNEQLGAHGAQLENHEGRITALENAFDDAWYVRLGLRAAWMTQDIDGFDNHVNEWDTDAGFGGAIAFGREFSMFQADGKFRAEVEFAYQGADLEDLQPAGHAFTTANGDVDVMTIMANGYYELPVYDAFALYAMAGLGFAQYNQTIALDGVEVADGNDNVFAYKLGAGMTYNFTDQIAGDLGYEYLGVADTDLADSINGHNVVASVRFKF